MKLSRANRIVGALSTIPILLFFGSMFCINAYEVLMFPFRIVGTIEEALSLIWICITCWIFIAVEMMCFCAYYFVPKYSIPVQAQFIMVNILHLSTSILLFWANTVVELPKITPFTAILAILLGLGSLGLTGYNIIKLRR